MLEKISKFIYKTLKILEFPLIKFFNKRIIIWFKEFIEKDAYRAISLKNSKKKIIVFGPNHLTNWMYDEFFLKEPETIDWINNFKNKTNKKIVFWDVGSNLGIYSIYASLFHKNIEVFSFEPSTSNLRILSRNISINKLQKKIKIIQLPLSNKNLSISNFWENKFAEGESNNTFDTKKNFEGKKFYVSNNYKILGVSANFLIEKKISSVPNYVKIDVDGLEHVVLKGFNKFLGHKNLIGLQIELNENYKKQIRLVFSILKKNNFKYINKKRNNNLKIYKLKKFSKIYNYYFEKK